MKRFFLFLFVFMLAFASVGCCWDMFATAEVKFEPKLRKGVQVDRPLKISTTIPFRGITVSVLSSSEDYLITPGTDSACADRRVYFKKPGTYSLLIIIYDTFWGDLIGAAAQSSNPGSGGGSGNKAAIELGRLKRTCRVKP